MEPVCRHHYDRDAFREPRNGRPCERTNERANESPGSRPGQRAGSREVRYVNYRPTYVSPSRSTTRPTSPSHPSCRGLPRLPADSSWNGPHRRSRCTQGSRETDESTLRPEERREMLVLPSFDLAAKEEARRGAESARSLRITRGAPQQRARERFA